MKKLSTLIVIMLISCFVSAQSNSNPNYQPAPTTTDAQRQLAQPANSNPNPQREVITPNVQPAVPPPQHQIPNPQQQNNASYQDNSRFYNKDNVPANSETNKVPTSNGDYNQPGYSNPINKPSTQ